MSLSRVSAVLLAVLTVACGPTVARSLVSNPAQIDVARLWLAPDDLETRDLLGGPGGKALAPDPATPFVFVKEDRRGYSPGFDVRGPDGTVWSVKSGPEAQPEVASSRLLWALGYHQPPTYYLSSWTLTGGPAGMKTGGRFRPEPPDRQVAGDWSWYENEFVDTQPFKGLIVANLLLNNWDWKTSNNKVYEVNATSSGPRRLYVVRDLGASLGKTSFPTFLKWMPMRGFGQGSRNDLDGFEEQGFIKGVEGERVDFHYRGIHGSLVKTVTRRDVIWTCALMERLSDRQLLDAFRAAGYSPDHASRYAAKLKSKVAEGLALRDR
jgi:hypothetical protein